MCEEYAVFYHVALDQPISKRKYARIGIDDPFYSSNFSENVSVTKRVRISATETGLPVVPNGFIKGRILAKAHRDFFGSP